MIPQYSLSTEFSLLLSTLSNILEYSFHFNRSIFVIKNDLTLCMDYTLRSISWDYSIINVVWLSFKSFFNMPSQNSNHFYNWVMGNIDFKFRLYIFLNSRTNWPYDIIFCLNCRIEFTFETACNAVFFGGQIVFPNDSIFTRWLHNYTVFASQRKPVSYTH